MTFNKIAAGVIMSIILLAMTPFALRLVWPRINVVSTGATPQYPDIQPQKFRRPVEQVFGAAVETAKSMGWDLIYVDRNQWTIDAIATTRFFKFKNDMTVTVTSDLEWTLVNIRAHSSIGRGDFGTNARVIRAFQAELAKRL